MFADDTNLFSTHKAVRYLLQIVNQGLENINQWSISNKLYFKYQKNKILIFPQTQSERKHSTPFTKTNNKQLRIATNRINKFWGVLSDENLSWKEHIKYNENKIAKNLRLLFRAKHYLKKRSLLVLY